MCGWSTLPQVYEFESPGQELGFALFKFDKTTALQAKRGSMRALDATYNYNAFTQYN